MTTGMIATSSAPGSPRTGFANAHVGAKTRICVFASVPPPLHGSTYAVELLLASDFAVAFDVRHINTAYVSSVHDIGRVTFRKIWLLLGYLRRLFRSHRQGRFHYIIVAPAFSTVPFLRDAVCILAAAWFTRARIVLWSHSNDALRLHERFPKVLRWFMPFVLRRAYHVVTLGERLRANFVPFVGSARVSAIPNGLPARPVRATRGRNGEVRVVYVSNMLRAKGWMELLRAAALVAEARPQLREPE